MGHRVLALLAIVVGGAGTVAALALARVIDPNKLAFWREAVKPIPRDWVAIPVAPGPSSPIPKSPRNI